MKTKKGEYRTAHQELNGKISFKITKGHITENGVFGIRYNQSLSCWEITHIQSGYLVLRDISKKKECVDFCDKLSRHKKFMSALSKVRISKNKKRVIGTSTKWWKENARKIVTNIRELTCSKVWDG
jgi:5-methylcytosine-specific restriction endonuclease McrBC GTP-binding regulatory subunit McrB